MRPENGDKWEIGSFDFRMTQGGHMTLSDEVGEIGLLDNGINYPCLYSCKVG